MSDKELTGLEWRLLLWVSLHDGMSLVSGKGAGCFASNKTLFAEAGCDYSAGCRSLSRLVDLGYLKREKVGRSTRYRVVFVAPDNLQAGNISKGPIGGKAASEAEPIGCQDNLETPRNLPETDRDYSLRSSRLDPVETGELDSPKVPHLPGAAQSDELRNGRADPVSWQRALRPQQEKDTAEAGLGDRSEFAALLPANIDALNLGAQVSRYEKAFDGIGRDPDRLTQPERERLNNFLWDMVETLGGTDQDAVAQQAQRLLDETIEY